MRLGHLLAALGFEFHFLGASVGPVQYSNHAPRVEILVYPQTHFQRLVYRPYPCTMDQWRGAMLIVIAAGPIFHFGVGAAIVASFGHERSSVSDRLRAGEPTAVCSGFDSE